MSTPLISIIIPVYNAEKYLQKCMNSLINQTYRNLEIICINNGSTDKSSNILKEYENKDKRIKVIETVNEGVSIARNKGIELIKGDYTMFVDSDDWIDLDTCEIALNKIKDENADIVMWSYVREFENKSLKKHIFDERQIIFEGESLKNIHRRFIGLTGEELSNVENADALCPVWGKLYKSSLIMDHNIQFIDIRKIGTYEDGMFNLHLFNYADKAVYIDQYFYHYRKNNNSSVTSKYNENLYRNWNNLYGIMNDYIKHEQLDYTFNRALFNRISIGILGLGLNILGCDCNFIKKIKMIKEIISSKQYRKAVKNLKIDYFPIHWKFFYFCAKHNLSLGLYLLLLCIKKIINR